MRIALETEMPKKSRIEIVISGCSLRTELG